MANMCRHCPQPVFGSGLCRRHYMMESYVPRAPRRTVRPKTRHREVDETWERISRQWLAQNPMCAACSLQGRMTPASVVDHVLPRKHFPHLKYSRENLQSLCATRPFSCHQRKTGMERRGIALDFVRRRKILFLQEVKNGDDQSDR